MSGYRGSRVCVCVLIVLIEDGVGFLSEALNGYGCDSVLYIEDCG